MQASLRGSSSISTRNNTPRKMGKYRIYGIKFGTRFPNVISTIQNKSVKACNEQSNRETKVQNIPAFPLKILSIIQYCTVTQKKKKKKKMRSICTYIYFLECFLFLQHILYVAKHFVTIFVSFSSFNEMLLSH